MDWIIDIDILNKKNWISTFNASIYRKSNSNPVKNRKETVKPVHKKRNELPVKLIKKRQVNHTVSNISLIH